MAVQADAPPLVVRGLTDVRSAREILWPAFRTSEGGVPELDYRQDVDMPRLRSEVADQPADARPDVLFIADPILFAREGLIEAVDGLDAGSRPNAWVDEQGRWVATYAQPIVAIYNAIYHPPPRAWADLADAAWQDRLVLEAPERMLTTGPAFAELRAPMGDDVWRGWLTRLAGSGLRQVADNERAVLEVATGSRGAGLANWNVARRVRPGSPVRHVFLDPTPCVPAFAVAVAGGRSPDLARRFVRWLASTDGQAAYGRTGRLPAIDVATAGAGAGVIPGSVARAAGTADWIADPDPWIATYRSIFPLEAAPAAGKLRG
jgi:ABC-type Fe3+ transport system substrate-binding protein